MAGAGHKLWSAGDVVAASGSTDINTALLQQIVGVYAASANRDAAFGGAGEPALSEGMLCYLNDTNELQVYTGSAWVTIGDPDVMVVDSANARVGVNTESPSQELDVVAATPVMRLTSSDTTMTDGQEMSAIEFYQSDAAGAGVSSKIAAVANNISGAQNLVFYTGSGASLTENMRLDSNGRLGVNDPDPGYALTVTSAGNVTPVFFWNSDSTVNANNYILQLEYSADGDCTNGYFIGFRDSVAQIGSIQCDSTSSVAFNTSSDYRLKSNVEDLADAVASVEALRPITFTFTRDTHQRVHQGFLAHEVADVYPLAITGEKDAMHPAVDAVLDDDGNELEPAQPETIAPQMIDASKLVPLLTAAVQELSARVAALEAA